MQNDKEMEQVIKNCLEGEQGELFKNLFSQVIKMQEDNIPEKFAVKCTICGGTDIANPIHRLELCKPMIRMIEGRIYFQGRLINQLMKSGFSVKTCYETDYPNDFTVAINNCQDSTWFRIFSINFIATKQSPTMLISSKVDL